jgi:glyoxylase-like metal-dependent hydrolase (beta-lactamase superfamily II)
MLAGQFPLRLWAASANLGAVPLADRITLIAGAGGNVVLFRGNTTSTLIDSGHAASAEALLALVDELGADAPVSRLFNTHWHEDHTGGNEVFRVRGASIIAHENTRLWLGADFDVEWRNYHHAPRPAAALPDQTFYVSGEMDLGGETVQYHHYPRAHTDGDIVLFFPDSNVMVAGGLLSDGHYPIADIATGGWIGELVAANEAMLALADDNTIIIPGTGRPLKKADLQAQFDMLSALYARMKELTQQGFSGQDMLKVQVTAEYDARWGDPTEFVLETYRGMWAHTSDMGGFI